MIEYSKPWGEAGRSEVVGPNRAAEIQVAINEIEGAGEALMKSVAELEDRLSLVLIPSVPSDQKPGPDGVPVNSPMVLRLRSLVFLLSLTRNRLEDIKRRLEL